MSRQERKNSRYVLSLSFRRARSLFRLIPMTILMAVGLLSLKVVEIVENGKRVQKELFVSTVEAKDEKAEESTPPEESASPSEEKAAEEHGTKETSTEEKATSESEEKSGEEKPAEGESGKKDKAEEPAVAPVDVTAPKEPRFNQREIDVLESLAERRTKLETWEQEISLREKVLEATEGRIDQKLGEMKILSDDIKKLLLSYNEQEDKKIGSLVKVYEAMKPKEAARIFEEMDMDILLQVIDRMNERRIAPVLANMSPEKAKEVTQQLAENHKLAKPTTADAISALTAPPEVTAPAATTPAPTDGATPPLEPPPPAAAPAP